MHDTSFCPAPWTSVFLNPDGRIDNCCISANDLGNVNRDLFTDIINGDVNVAVKQSILNQVLPIGCSNCTKSDRSLRTEYIKWFERTPKELYSSADNFQLKYLDLRWRNTCNLACVYCNSELSSSWAQELGQVRKIENNQLRSLQSYIMQNLSELDYVYLAGGEPLLIKENESLLEQLYKENPDCQLRVNTNLSNIDNRIFELITKFDHVHWIVSGEGIGDQYNYVRYGGNWDEFYSNLKELKTLTNRHSVTFNSVYCALTTESIFDFADEIGKLKFDINTICPLYYNNGAGGPLDPRNLPSNVVNKAKETLQHNLTLIPPGYFSSALKEILNTLNMSYNNETFTYLFDTIKELDVRRGLDSTKIFPTIYQSQL
jgi:MoaA/NifB/PqqE/SkfB family radical SAM enzyme